MAHERGNCKDSCISDKKNCYHNITCTIVRQFTNGRWLIENPHHYVKALDPENIVFEEGEYVTHHNPNAAPQFGYATDLAIKSVVNRVDEEDFNAKLLRLKRTLGVSPETSVHANINGSASDVDHWDDNEKAWHTKDCKVVSR